MSARRAAVALGAACATPVLAPAPAGAHGIADAVSQYVRAVKDKTFPAAEHSF